MNKPLLQWIASLTFSIKVTKSCRFSSQYLELCKRDTNKRGKNRVEYSAVQYGHAKNPTTTLQCSPQSYVDMYSGTSL